MSLDHESVYELLIQHIHETPADWVDLFKVLRGISTRFRHLVDTRIRSLSLKNKKVQDVEKALLTFPHLQHVYLHVKLGKNPHDEVARLLQAIHNRPSLQIVWLWGKDVLTTGAYWHIENSNLARDCLPLGLRKLQLGGEVMETFSHDQARLLFEQQWVNLSSLELTVSEDLLFDDTLYAILARASRAGSFPVLEILIIGKGEVSNENVSCLAQGDWSRLTELWLDNAYECEALSLATMKELRVATPVLTCLNMSGAAFQVDACKMVGHLKRLVLRDCGLDVERLTIIAFQCDLCDLEFLDLSYNTFLPERDTPGMYPLLDTCMPKLKELHLNGCGVNSENLPYVLLVQESFLDEVRAPELEVLSLRDNPVLFSPVDGDIDDETVGDLLRWEERWGKKPMSLIMDYTSGIQLEVLRELDRSGSVLKVEYDFEHEDEDEEEEDSEDDDEEDADLPPCK